MLKNLQKELFSVQLMDREEEILYFCPVFQIQHQWFCQRTITAASIFASAAVFLSKQNQGIMKIFNLSQLKKSEKILNSPYSKLSDLKSSDIRELAVAWCYYSGKIEGNTYTYVETEALLKDGITSEKRYEDAKMLKNLHNAFVGELEYIHKEGHQETIDERTLLRLHSSLSTGLVSGEDSGQFRSRPVRISGTEYIPPRDIYEIRFKLSEVLYRQLEMENPLERAVYLHCNIARIQPFIDCNKRTARMVESIVMMNAGLIPVYSSKDSDLLNYRKGLVSFYESENYNSYTDFFLDRQLSRINALDCENEL